MKYSTIEKDLIEAHQNLLEIQYFNKPKARKHVENVLKPFLINGLFWKFQDKWLDVENSIGKQLDQIGKWVGVDRNYKGININGEFYAYYDYQNKLQPNVEQGGLYDTNTDNIQFPFIDESGLETTKNSLKDNDFRFLIKLKIIKNNESLTCGNIDFQLNNIFNNQIFVIWEKMKMTYKYPVSLDFIMKLAKEKSVLPCPTGCHIQLEAINE